MSESLFGRRTALFLGGGVLVGFAVVASFATLDKKNLAVIEKIEEPSAAGEAVVYKFPEEGGYDPTLPIVTVKGVALFEDEILRRPDGAMMKAGHDDEGKVPLYRRLRSDILQEPLYVKLAPERYLRLSSKPPKKRLEAPAGEEGLPAQEARGDAAKAEGGEAAGE